MVVLTRRSIIFLSVLALALVVLTYLVYALMISPTGMRAQRDATLSVLDAAAPASFETLDGTPMSLRDFQGKPLVVNVWASWSPYTPDEHRVLHTLAGEVGDRASFVALNRREPVDVAMAYLDTIGRYDDITYIMDDADSFFTHIGGYAMPETVVFDSVGNIAYHKRGVLTADEIKGVLEPLFAGVLQD